MTSCDGLADLQELAREGRERFEQRLLSIGINGIEPMLTAEKVSEILQFDIQTVYRKAQAGEIPCIHFGNKVRFSASKIRAIASCEIKGNSL